MQDFYALPLSVQEEAKDTLRVYSEAYIRFYEGRYHVSTGIMICSHYPADFKVIGDVSKDDIYTPDEQTVNYIENFYDYPPGYKGSRDYNMLDYLREQRGKARVKLMDGTAQLII